ncbi:phosphotransferase [Candidatus Hydrogenedentota bacterium]
MSSEKTINARRAFQDAVESYIKRRLLPSFGIGGDFQLTVPARGARSVIFKITPTKGTPFMVRCVPRIADALRLKLVTSHFVSRGAPVPRILTSDCSLKTFLSLRCCVLAEEYIDGNHPEEVDFDLESVRKGMTALAQLHDISRSRWGRLGFGRRRGYFKHLMKRTSRRIEELVNHGAMASSGGMDIARFLNSFEKAISSLDSFSLCHMRINSNNVMIPWNADARLIDITTARYASFVIDLIRALHRWTMENRRKMDVLREHYLALRGENARHEHDDTYGFHHAVYHVSQANRAAKRLKKLGDRDVLDGYWTRDNLEVILNHNLSELKKIADASLRA